MNDDDLDTSIDRGAPILATGTQRSGTTLVHHILNCCSAIWSMNEMYSIHPMLFDPTAYDAATFQTELRRCLNKKVNTQSLEHDGTSRASAFNTAMNEIAASAGKSRWCLKDPRISYFLDNYAKEFPLAKFVVLIRDPRAVVNSYLHSPGFRVGRPINAYTGAIRWTTEIAHQQAFAQEHADRVLTIKYEELIRDFPNLLDRLCKFVNIDVEAGMQSYFDQRKNVKVHRGNENILNPPDSVHIDKWKTKLSPRQIQCIESVVKPHLQEFGYEPMTSGHPVNPIARIAYRAEEAIVSRIRWQKFKFSQRK